MVRRPRKVRMKKVLSIWMSVMMLITMTIVASPLVVFAAGTSYYVDSAAGSDSNNGTSSSTPWKTLTNVDAKTFVAGDQILLKAGSSFTGQLYPKGSGASGSPIKIDMYGTGNKPIIAANGAYDAAVKLQNQPYWEISNLEVTNTASTAADLKGVYVTAVDYGTLNHVYVSNCYIHDISGLVKWASDYGMDAAKRNGGICFDVLPGTGSVITNFNDIQIINNKLQDCAMIPIGVWQNKSNGWVDRTSSTDTTYYPNTNVIVRKNYIQKVNNANQACVLLLVGCKDTVAEYNTIASGLTSGMESACSLNVTYQYNEIANVLRGNVGGNDRCALDQDIESVNAIYQYNYVHDSGYGLLVYGSNFGTNFKFRYNILQNNLEMHVSMNIQDISGTAALYNNVFYTPSTSSCVFTTGSLTGGTATLNNNIFYGPGTFTTTHQTYDYNCFYGMTTTPTDAHKVTTDPLFVDPGKGLLGSYENGPAFSTLTGYKLKSGSPCITKGIAISSNGGKDFFGTTVGTGSPNIGAYEGSGSSGSVATNCALTGTASASSVASTTYPASKAIDNSVALTTGWKASSTSSPQWLQIDLGSAKTISAFKLYHASSTAYAPKNFKIQGSADGTTFTDLVTVTGNSSTSTTHVITPVSYRYFRLYITAVNTGGDSVARCSEFQIMSY